MKSNKKVIAIIAVIVSLVVLACGGALLWFKTGVFNFLKPKQDVFTSQVEQVLNLDGIEFSDYSNILKEYKEYANKSSKGTLNIAANLNISELDKDVQKTINNSKLALEFSSDPENSNAQNKIGIYSNNSEVLTLDLVTNDSKIGIGCEDLYDKYLSVSSEELVSYLEKNSKSLGIKSDEIEALKAGLSSSSLDIYELLYISEEDLKHFDDTYRNCLSQIISKDCFTSKTGVKVDVDGEDVKTTAYYCTLTGSDAYDAVTGFTNLIAEDDTITKIVTEKVNLILKAANQDTIKEKEIQEIIDEFIEELNSSVKSIDGKDDSAIQVAIYSKSNKPVRLELNIIEDTDNMDEVTTIISIEYAKDKNIYTINTSNGKNNITIIDNIKKNSKEERVGQLSLNYSGIELGTLDYEFVIKKSESKINLDLDIPSADVNAKLEFSSEGDAKKEKVKFEGSISFSYSKESAEIKFDGTTEYTEDVSIPTLSSKNSVAILTLTEKELQKLATDILTNASKVLPSRLKLIGININAKDILPSSTNKTEETKNNDDTTEKATNEVL